MGFGSGYSERNDRGMEGRTSYKRVFANGQAPHVWAQQTQDDGRTPNGNLYWKRRDTIHSYRDNWPLATFTDMRDGEGKKIVLMNTEKYSLTTSGHLDDVQQALIGLPGIRIVTCTRDQLVCWSHSPSYAKVDMVNTAIRGLINTAKRYLKASLIDSRETSRVKWCLGTTAETTNTTTILTWEQRCKSRIADLDVMSSEITDLAALLGVDMATASGLLLYDVPVMQAAIAGEFSRYYDPALAAKREKARRASAKRALLDRVKNAFNAYSDGHWSKLKHTARIEAAVRDVWTLGTEEHKAKAMRWIGEFQAANELDASFTMQNPDAGAVVYRRKYGYARVKALTPDEWMAGKAGTLGHSSETLVRRKGDRLETSRHAEAPFKHAVAIFAKAQDCRATGSSWHRNGETMTAGHFQLDAIDTEGNIAIGCHRIRFSEMNRLAVREVPAMVKPRYALPMVI
jgi:hypothetical protein